MMTHEHWVVLVAQAQQVADSTPDAMIRKMTQSTLTDLKACFGLT